jgi:hypothetical protein
MLLVHVGFTDQTETAVSSFFDSPQDPESFPYQGVIPDDDPRYLAFLDHGKISPADEARAQRDSLLSLAAIRIAPLQDAVDIDDATAADVALLKKWKQYRVALNRIQDQAGFPGQVDWPVAPE